MICPIDDICISGLINPWSISAWYIDHVARRESDDLNDLAHVSCVGSVLRYILHNISKRQIHNLDYLGDLDRDLFDVRKLALVASVYHI